MFAVGFGNITIDWGGDIETHTLLPIDEKDPSSWSNEFNDRHKFERIYDDSPPKTITVTGALITHFAVEASEIDISNNTALRSFTYLGGSLTDLDVSKNTNLINLNIRYGYTLNGLDLSKNTELEYLGVSNCDFNKPLDLTNNKKLWGVSLYQNNFSADFLNNVFRTLHNDESINSKQIYVYENLGNDDCDVSIAENKGWIVYK
jgi:uncharacterized protein YueI